ncbi:MAG TPA: hypothetical protein P5556_03900 [Candidatus Gastranaerophilales bacterium]|nr:hypothetical protein [Candidatus Gastranaerophilales bacterium]
MALNLTNNYSIYDDDFLYKKNTGNQTNAIKPAFGETGKPVNNVNLSQLNWNFDVREDFYRAKKTLNNLHKIKQGVNRFGKITQKQYDNSKLVLGALGALPPIRRINSLPDSLETDNIQRASGLVTLALLNFPGDLREIKSAGREFCNIYSKFKANNMNLKEAGGIKGLFENASGKLKGYQYPFAFFRGTMLDKFVRKHQFLLKSDVTLYDTKFGEFIRKTFKTGAEKVKNVSKELGMPADVIINARLFEGNMLARLINTSCMRTSVFGLAATTLIEMPAMVKSIQKEDDFKEKSKSTFKQFLKSSGYIILSTAGIALGGAAGAIMLPGSAAIVSLLGMGIGSFAGLSASRGLNKSIDKI